MVILPMEESFYTKVRQRETCQRAKNILYYNEDVGGKDEELSRFVGNDATCHAQLSFVNQGASRKLTAN